MSAVGSHLYDLRPQPIRLAISTTPTFASKWLIPRLSDLTVRHPDLDIHIVATERISNLQVDGTQHEALAFRRISFNQTSHAIDAAIAGQGIGLLPAPS